MTGAASRYKSKTLATWLALLGGTVGLHRFYLHGFRDRWGWLFVWPSLVGLYGVQRMRHLGGDDHLAWVLIPILGVMLSIAMLTAIVYGLTPDEKWNARFNRNGPQHQMNWATVIGVAAALIVGGGVLMATLAFSAQRYFEYQAEMKPLGERVRSPIPQGDAGRMVHEGGHFVALGSGPALGPLAQGKTASPIQ